ncbi:MAG: aminopeptidase P family protein [Oscillospiraceae bacterium]|nr:aminopeptidase P family protein [Oscillospiraceae bacterium]MBR0452131.1 aminopeptidase P family protein [Oscillospiraceae bacterium]
MNRIEKLRNKLPANTKGAIVISDTNREYLSKLLSSAGTLLIFPDTAYFIIDSRYIEVAKKNVVGAEVILQGKLYEQISELCSRHGIDEVLCEEEISLAEYNALKANVGSVHFIADDTLSSAIQQERAIKEPKELKMICDAQAITDAAFLEILNFIKPGVSEKQVAAELEYTMRKLGADGLAFETIVASGTNGSMPHAVPSDKLIQNGEFVTMDYGAKLCGYCSDMTRTVAVGEVGEEQKRIYDTVLNAHLSSMAAAKAGVYGDYLDKIARDIIYEAGYEGCFGHSLGHSLGLDIHEKPMSSYARHDLLPAGTIMTIEPGIYIEGKYGVRIENMIFITEKGYKNLTGSERKLITL